MISSEKEENYCCEECQKYIGKKHNHVVFILCKSMGAAYLQLEVNGGHHLQTACFAFALLCRSYWQLRPTWLEGRSKGIICGALDMKISMRPSYPTSRHFPKDETCYKHDTCKLLAASSTEIPNCKSHKSPFRVEKVNTLSCTRIT